MAGRRLGKQDERHLWPEMLRTIREIKPRWVVGENVLGLVNWSGGLVFEEVQADLEAEGYEVQPFILPAASVNAPHRRDRVWFIAYSFNSRYKTGRGAKEEKDGVQAVHRKEMVTREFNGTSLSSTTPNANGFRLQQCEDTRKMGRGQGKIFEKGDKPSNAIKANGKATTTPNANNQGCERNRTQPKPKEQKQVSSRHWHYVRENIWQNFPTQSPICKRDDGLPTELDGITFSKWRNESIKAFGNAIVPQVALQIFKAIQAYETTRQEM